MDAFLFWLFLGLFGFILLFCHVPNKYKSIYFQGKHLFKVWYFFKVCLTFSLFGLLSFIMCVVLILNEELLEIYVKAVKELAEDKIGSEKT